MSFGVLNKRYQVFLIPPNGKISGDMVENIYIPYYPYKAEILIVSEEKTEEKWRREFLKKLCMEGKRSFLISGIESHEWFNDSIEQKTTSQSEILPQSDIGDAFASFDEKEKSADIRWIFLITGTREYPEVKEIIKDRGIERVFLGGRKKAGSLSFMKKKVPVITDNKNAVTIQKEVFQPYTFRAHDAFADIQLWITPLDSGDIIIGNALPKDHDKEVWELIFSQFAVYIQERAEMGNPIKGVFVELLHIYHHPVDSTARAYKGCIKAAMNEALNRAGTPVDF
ncbi:MAG: hypothetical protein GY760_06320 [Deltaproteobacteria bacterium]|nr:hypothetical protein [Deltaproteobacteria bacterium]